MAVITNSIFIERSPEDVFDYCSNLANELKWNPQAKTVEQITPGPVGVGTKFKAEWKGSGLATVECIVYNRPLEWAYTDNGSLNITSHFNLEPQGTGTVLNTHFEPRPKGFMKIMLPLLLPMFKKQFPKNLQNIKAKLEDPQSN